MTNSTTTMTNSPPKPRVFIISDISNEPDDAESLVRYLLYAHQFHTEGLVACTSTWMPRRVCPQDMHRIVDAYGEVVGNLNRHVDPGFAYPAAEELKELIKSGPEVYGFEAVGDDIPLAEGSQLLVTRLLHPSPAPLWILLWGGANVLAQALWHLRRTATPASLASICRKIRVYSISDQDNCGGRIRREFPDIFYIASVHAWNHYGLATWTGISGERYYGFDQGGPDYSQLTKRWFRENVQIGPLGAVYPDYMFIPEGDTPTFLYLIQNGLGVSEHPEYGSWGGRYARVEPMGRGIISNHYSDCHDVVIGKDGRTYKSPQATIWRWRNAFQNDFAARIQWTLGAESTSRANHHPVVTVNGSQGIQPLEIEIEAGTTLRLDATGTYDPDSDELTYKWWHYREPSASQWSAFIEVDEMVITPVPSSNGAIVDVNIPKPERCAVELLSRQAVEKGQKLHVILEVTDNGTPALTSYKRIVIQTTNRELRGGDAQGRGEAIGEAFAAMVDRLGEEEWR